MPVFYVAVLNWLCMPSSCTTSHTPDHKEEPWAPCRRPLVLFSFFDQVIDPTERNNFGFRAQNGPNIVVCLSCKMSKLPGLSNANDSLHTLITKYYYEGRETLLSQNIHRQPDLPDCIRE